MNRNERITNGMRLLDNYKPGWDSDINLADLDLASSCKCVLGQVYGSYQTGLSMLGINGGSYTTTGWANGFTDSVDYSGLTQAWREAIAQRRLKDMPIAVS